MSCAGLTYASFTFAKSMRRGWTRGSSPRVTAGANAKSNRPGTAVVTTGRGYWIARSFRRAMTCKRCSYRPTRPNSHPLHKAIHHLLLPRPVEGDGELVALDLHHIAVAEFLVEHAVADGVGRDGAGRFRHQFAFDGQRAGPRAAPACSRGACPSVVKTAR